MLFPYRRNFRGRYGNLIVLLCLLFGFLKLFANCSAVVLANKYIFIYSAFQHKFLRLLHHISEYFNIPLRIPALQRMIAVIIHIQRQAIFPGQPNNIFRTAPGVRRPDKGNPLLRSKLKSFGQRRIQNLSHTDQPIFLRIRSRNERPNAL